MKAKYDVLDKVIIKVYDLNSPIPPPDLGPYTSGAYIIQYNFTEEPAIITACEIKTTKRLLYESIEIGESIEITYQVKVMDDYISIPESDIIRKQ